MEQHIALIPFDVAGPPTVEGQYLVHIRERNGYRHFEILHWQERGGFRLHPTATVTHYAFLRNRAWPPLPSSLTNRHEE